MEKMSVLENGIIHNGQIMPSLEICEWGLSFPLYPSQKIETRVIDGYRFIVADGRLYKFHRSTFEVGRPQLMLEILEVMQFLISFMPTGEGSELL